MNLQFSLRGVLLIGLLGVLVWSGSMKASPMMSSTKLMFVGEAYGIAKDDEGELLYSEHHTVYLGSDGKYQNSIVEYRDPGDQVVAVKTLSFNSMQTMPELEFTDYRTNSSFITKNTVLDGERYVLLESKRAGSVDNAMVEVSDQFESITDAGFDLFVASNWGDLVNGETLELDFLALTRAAYFTFKLERERINHKELVLRLKPRSFFIGLLMKPIYLTYDVNNRRLLRFEGLTNIERVTRGKPDGENYVARIEYRYIH